MGNKKMSTIIMSGGTSGLGRQALLALSSNPVHVILLARNEERAAAVRQEVEQAHQTKVSVIPCDMSSMSSVHDALLCIVNQAEPIDVLVNNAAINTPERQVTADGFETMFATNFLAPFIITQGFLKAVGYGNDPRIINVGGPIKRKPDIDDLNSRQGFAQMAAFESSKAALGLYTAYLHRTLQEENSSVSITGFYPGIMRSNLSSGFKGLIGIGERLIRHTLPGPEESGRFLAKLITTPNLSSQYPGLMYNNNGQEIDVPNADDYALQEALIRRANDMAAPWML
ncbi:SDR family NAD(P)-dependent oxidoreductase [Bifidobacterium tissieri]|uniref:SDR family NAD(P)-dependent oxidoreductase n=1 Tax=Bifidobacterium tissieri TaxID=1630162 RepID=A0A5M9ZWQ2_9BIFI|nr:SDR family NAD(P)-dependent oxidoreductase [Bifidobacterium tissieri]KAA8831965.1 SDR family NAD(P)-dependent oxidoreductase [Bifidobacterium tissieri]